MLQIEVFCTGRMNEKRSTVSRLRAQPHHNGVIIYYQQGSEIMSRSTISAFQICEMFPDAEAARHRALPHRPKLLDLFCYAGDYTSFFAGARLVMDDVLH